MEIISKPAGGNKRSSYTYTHTRNRLPSHCKRVRATATDKACPYWLAGNCKYVGDDCKYLHSHVIGGSDVTFLTKLVGHDNKVRLGLVCSMFLSCQIIVGFLICSAYSSALHIHHLSMDLEIDYEGWLNTRLLSSRSLFEGLLFLPIQALVNSVLLAMTTNL